MARMLRAHATTTQRETSTYCYGVKANLRAREERTWRREWAADELDYWHERHGLCELLLTLTADRRHAGGTSG